MGYFRDNYSALRFPIAEDHDVGLRRGQLGAIHGLASHFTMKKHPAIVTMPTGSGKTAVLMATAFLQRCRVKGKVIGNHCGGGKGDHFFVP